MKDLIDALVHFIWEKNKHFIWTKGIMPFADELQTVVGVLPSSLTHKYSYYSGNIEVWQVDICASFCIQLNLFGSCFF